MQIYQKVETKKSSAFRAFYLFLPYKIKPGDKEKSLIVNNLGLVNFLSVDSFSSALLDGLNKEETRRIIFKFLSKWKNLSSL